MFYCLGVWASEQIYVVCGINTTLKPCLHKFHVHSHENDTQFQVGIIPKETLMDIGAWVRLNMLTVNQEKAELIILKPKHQWKANDKIQLQLGEDCPRKTVSACILMHL